MPIADLTLAEIYDLESRHPPLVGSRTAVFRDCIEEAVSPNEVHQVRLKLLQYLKSDLTVAVFDKTACIKISGRADFSSSLDLKKLIGELSQRDYNHLVFELSDCHTMDSTFLGVLSGIGLQFSNDKSGRKEAPLELFNPNPCIAETLENLGVSDLFAIKTGTEPLTNKFEPLVRPTEKSQLELTRNCLEAHTTLMSIQPQNVHKFKEVAQFLADDLKRLEAAG